jgi:hypothetical protein
MAQRRSDSGPPARLWLESLTSIDQCRAEEAVAGNQRLSGNPKTAHEPAGYVAEEPIERPHLVAQLAAVVAIT